MIGVDFHPKRVYASPQLLEYGSIAKLTRGEHGSFCDPSDNAMTMHGKGIPVPCQVGAPPGQLGSGVAGKSR